MVFVIIYKYHLVKNNMYKYVQVTSLTFQQKTSNDQKTVASRPSNFDPDLRSPALLGSTSTAMNERGLEWHIEVTCCNAKCCFQEEATPAAT